MSTRVLLALAVSTSLSLLFTPVVRQVALKLDIVDRPRRRHVHDIHTHHRGGVSM